MSPKSFSFRTAQLETKIVDGTLIGLGVGPQFIPFPGIGLESELGVVVPGAKGCVQAALTAILDQRSGVPAAAQSGSSYVDAVEVDREFDLLGSSYRELDHLEINTWYRRSARAARKNLERLLDASGRWASASGENVLLHATGGDGQGNSWSSLHVNVGISELMFDRLLQSYRKGLVAYDWYLPAQITLSVVDGNGGIDRKGYVVSDRLPVFDRVFGVGTMRPMRSMLVNRDEHFGNARIMNMLRPLSFGEAQIAGLTMTQLDCLITDLIVHGVLNVPSNQLGDPILAARELAMHENRKATARIQRKIQETRRRVVEALQKKFGPEFVEDLIPGLEVALDFVDATLSAIEADDEAEVLARCDWARKLDLLLEFQEARGASWSSLYEELMAINVHYARLDSEALRHEFAETKILEAGDSNTGESDNVPEETSSYLLWWVVERAQHDASFARELEDTCLSWKGFTRSTTSWVPPVGGYWPWASQESEEIKLVPWLHNKALLDERLRTVSCLGDLFDLLGDKETKYGDYAGRSYGSAGAER